MIRIKMGKKKTPKKQEITRRSTTTVKFLAALIGQAMYCDHLQPVMAKWGLSSRIEVGVS